jgi:hypothetical protein
MRNALPKTAIAALQEEAPVGERRTPTPRTLFELTFAILPGQSTAPKMPLWVLPEKVLSVQPTNKSSYWAAFDTPDTSAVL